MLRRFQLTIGYCILSCGVFFYFLTDGLRAETSWPVTQQEESELARLEISFYRGTLALDGHVASPEHERQLLLVASRTFSGAEARTRFSRLFAVPERWDVSTLSLLKALAATRSARAILADQRLMIRGVGTSEWNDQLERLPANVSAAA